MITRCISAAGFVLVALLATSGVAASDEAGATAPIVMAQAERASAGRPTGDITAPGPELGRALPASGTHDLSPWGMFLAADVVVKAIMVGLAFASLVTWTILLAKTFEIARARRRIAGQLRRLSDCRTLVEAESAFPATAGGVTPQLVAEAVREYGSSARLSAGSGVRDRAASRFQEVVKAEGRSIRVGMGLLATIGSTSPFVGLFGTVWGIMNSFVGIAKTQTTNLAVVAPGIAEALLATAIGLVAAIPAVVVYNHFSRATKDYLDLVGRAAGAVARLLSLDLDRARDGVAARLAAE